MEPEEPIDRIDPLDPMLRMEPEDPGERDELTGACIRPFWMSVWARWRETEIHHADLDAGYTHRQWPAEFVGLLLPRVLPTLAGRLTGGVTVRAEVSGGARATGDTCGDAVIVRGPAPALLCWLVGRPLPAAELTVTRGGRPWQLPVLKPWA